MVIVCHGCNGKGQIWNICSKSYEPCACCLLFCHSTYLKGFQGVNTICTYMHQLIACRKTWFHWTCPQTRNHQSFCLKYNNRMVDLGQRTDLFQWKAWMLPGHHLCVMNFSVPTVWYTHMRPAPNRCVGHRSDTAEFVWIFVNPCCNVSTTNNYVYVIFTMSDMTESISCRWFYPHGYGLHISTGSQFNKTVVYWSNKVHPSSIHEFKTLVDYSRLCINITWIKRVPVTPSPTMVVPVIFSGSREK